MSSISHVTGRQVLDSRGNVIWSVPNVPKQTGGMVTVTYAGPALQAGWLYQFRAISFRRDNIAISATEDLRGVFLVQ